MDPPTSLHGIIPEDKLKIWEIFSDVGPEGEEILKRAKLVHAHDIRGLVVTMEDETYCFYRGEVGGVKITTIPELCGVRVKEHFIGSTGLTLTEDGHLYSWHRTGPSFVVHPAKGSLTGQKVVQVSSSVEGVLALTSGGTVHHWIWKDAPTLIAREKFDNKKVISVAGNEYLNVALTEDGELFEWKLCQAGPRKSALSTCSPIKKITASENAIFALTVVGTMYSWDSENSDSGNADPVWMPVPDYKNVQDIATCVLEDVSVVELKTEIRLGRYVGNRAPWSAPFFTKSTSLDESFAEVCQKSYRTMLVAREPEPRKLGDDISTLWSTKKNADVKFSVEGKIITAHKLIVTLRSEYFEKMFRGEWAENEGSVVYIKDTKYDVFEAFLFYIYHDRIPFSNSDYEKLYSLMKLADFYCEVTIRRECEKILMQNINTTNAFFLLKNAASANAMDLEEEVTKFILDNRLFIVTLSSAELVESLGREAFDKLAMASFCR